jgi:hypothetical protein
MPSSGKHPIDSTVDVDEFVLGGYEEWEIGRNYEVKKKKASIALQFTYLFKLYI